MSRVRRLHYEGLIWRFQFLMLATLITCAMTAIGFILGQVAEGQYKWDENISLEYMSGFMTGKDSKRSEHHIVLIKYKVPQTAWVRSSKCLFVQMQNSKQAIQCDLGPMMIFKLLNRTEWPKMKL